MGEPKHSGGIQTYRGESKQSQQAEKCCQQCYTYGGIQTYRGHTNNREQPNIKAAIQTYGWCPNIWGPVLHIWGHPNIQEVSIHMGASKQTGGIQTIAAGWKVLPAVLHIWGHPNIQGAPKHTGHSISLTNHAFFVLCMYRGIQTYSGHPNIGGPKHTGDI